MARIPKQRVIFDAEKYDLDYLRETRDSYSPMKDAEFEDSISYDMGEPEQPVSLKTAAKEARAASAALSAHGAPTVDLEHEAEDARKASEALSCTHDDH